MIPEITNNNVHLLIPGKAAHFARIYTEQHGGTMLEALRAFYSSKMYHELEDESTLQMNFSTNLREKLQRRRISTNLGEYLKYLGDITA